jgi:hypothetical protein
MLRWTAFALLVMTLARGDATNSINTTTGTATVATATTTATTTGTSTAPAPDIPGLTTRVQAGDPCSCADLSLAYFTGNGVPKDLRKGFDLSLEAAMQGELGGIRNLGYAYRTGLGVHLNRDKAYAWYLKGAQQGDDLCELNVGLFEQFGGDRVANAYSARQWMEKAAIRGQPEAEARYGDMLVCGIGGPADLKKGFAYYLRSAPRFAPARYLIAKCYANGTYVARDPVLAWAWCVTAEGTKPDPKMADFPGKLESSSTVDQLAQATKLSKDLLKNNQYGPDQPDSMTSSLAPGASVTLKFQSVTGFIVVSLTLQDKEPVDFIVDTGCPSSFIDARLAPRFGLTGANPIAIGGVGPGLELMNLADGVTLAAPGLRLSGARLGLMDNFDFDRHVGQPIAGFLGIDILRHFIVHIDNQAHTLTLTQPGKDAPVVHGTELPLHFDHNSPFIPATLSSGTVTGSTADFLLDTGDRGDLSVGPGYQSRNPGLDFRSQVSSSIYGFGGLTDIGEGTANIALGPHLLKDVPTDIASRHTVAAFENWLSNGDLGRGIWTRFDLTLDFPAAKVELTPNARFNEPFLNNESGAGLWTAAGDYHTFLVFAVTPDSPAASAGVKTGDQLTAIDGKPTDPLTLDQIFDTLRPLGNHEYKVRRDGADLTFQVATYDPLRHPEQIPLYQTQPDLHPPGTKIASLAVNWMGTAIYPDAVILRASGLHVGDVYLQGTGNRALKQLYASGLFANVGLHADTTKDGLKVSLLVQPRPLVKTVTFTGLTPEEETALRPRLIAEEGLRISSTDLFKDAAMIKGQLGKNNPADRTVSIHLAYDDGTMQQRDVSIPKSTP